MKISHLGEWDLIDQISKRFSRPLPPGTIGIGDDTAVLPSHSGKSQLVTTDMLVEGTHFLADRISAPDLGYKSLAVNLSDIASMGGQPTSVFLSLGLPGHIESGWVDGFFNGFQELADTHCVNLLGGDTTESKSGIVINVTVLGEIETQFIRLRSQARPGDWICVTGCLGDSIAGLNFLLHPEIESSFSNILRQRHWRPKPYVTEGQWLARQTGLHAMMDVSDGLHLTLKEISRRSQCGIEVDLGHLPVSAELREAGRKLGWNVPEMAAAGGEDYVLLFTVSTDSLQELQKNYEKEFQSKIHPIGRITNSGSMVYLQNGVKFEGDFKIWNHFSGKN